MNNFEKGFALGGLVARVPSPQWWNARTHLEKIEWRDKVVSLGQDPDSLLNEMKRRFPKAVV
jgi:hypothetical protein